MAPSPPSTRSNWGATISVNWNTGQSGLSADEEAAPSGILTAANETTYFGADHLGSTRMEFAGGGWPTWSEDYAPYGQEVPPVQSTQNHYKFTSYERDPETGNDYAQARYYSSTIQGRFTSPDPDAGSMNLADPQTLNRYSYAMNNPVKFIDPTGLEGWSVDANGCAVYTWSDNTETGGFGCFNYDAASAGYGPEGGYGGGGGGGGGDGCCSLYTPGQELDAAYDEYASQMDHAFWANYPLISPFADFLSASDYAPAPDNRPSCASRLAAGIQQNTGVTPTNLQPGDTVGGHATYTFNVPDPTGFQNTLNQNGPWPLGPLQFLDAGSRYGIIESTHIENTRTGGLTGHTDIFNGHILFPLHVLVDVVIGHIPGVNLDFGCKAGL